MQQLVALHSARVVGCLSWLDWLAGLSGLVAVGVRARGLVVCCGSLWHGSQIMLEHLLHSSLAAWLGSCLAAGWAAWLQGWLGCLGLLDLWGLLGLLVFLSDSGTCGGQPVGPKSTLGMLMHHSNRIVGLVRGWLHLVALHLEFGPQMRQSKLQHCHRK